MEINYHCTLRMKMYLYYRIRSPDLISAYCKRIAPLRKKYPYNNGERVWKLITSSGFLIEIYDNGDILNFIKEIYCSPSKTEERDAVLECLKNLTAELPYRGDYVKDHGILGKTTYILMNGKDETEFALLDVLGTYLSLHFYFNKSLTECTGIRP